MPKEFFDRNYPHPCGVFSRRTFGRDIARTIKSMGAKAMEPVINTEVRELCRAVSQEKDSERLKRLVDELLTVLDERQLLASLL
jgi:hypothetical protein